MYGAFLDMPTALVNMEIDGLQVCVEAAVCKSLPVSVLLGTYVPELFTLLSRVRSREDSGMAVVTRSKFKQQQVEAREEQVRDLQSGARPTPVEEPTAKEKEPDTSSVPEAQSYDGGLPGAGFHQVLFTGRRSRKVLTRSQKRERKKEYSEHGPSRTQEYQKWEFHPEEIQRLQREDETLKDIRGVAADSALEKGAEFFHRDGTYYRNRNLRGEIVEQLILPEACRDPVLQMAHAIPMAGLGQKENHGAHSTDFFLAWCKQGCR